MYQSLSTLIRRINLTQVSLCRALIHSSMKYPYTYNTMLLGYVSQCSSRPDCGSAVLQAHASFTLPYPLPPPLPLPLPLPAGGT